MPEVQFPLEAKDLQRWIRFAGRNGIGKGIALNDNEAEVDGLMFFKDEEVVFLNFLGNNSYLGYCEGVVGKFDKRHVKLTTQLKRPVLSPRTQAGSILIPAPPYSRSITSLSNYSERSEVSTQQIYYDALDAPQFDFNSTNCQKEQACDDLFLSPPFDDSSISQAATSPTLSYKSLDPPSLFSSPSSQYDQDLPLTPHWESTELPKKSYSELDHSYATSLAYYRSITPEPISKNDSSNSQLLSLLLRSTSSDSQASTITQMVASHFSDNSIKESNSGRRYSGETSWNTYPDEEESFFLPSTSTNTRDDTSELNILDFYGVAKGNTQSIAETNSDASVYDSDEEEAEDEKLNTIRFSEEIISSKEVGLLSSLNINNSTTTTISRSGGSNVLDYLRRGSIPTSPSLNSIVGIPPSESHESLFSNISSSSSESSDSEWHGDSVTIASATIFHQPYFSPILLGKEPQLTTYTSNIPDSSPLQQARLSRLASRSTPSSTLSNSLRTSLIPPLVPPRLHSTTLTSSLAPTLSVRTTNFTIPLSSNSSADQYTRNYPQRDSNLSSSPPSSNYSPASSAWSELPTSTSGYSLASSVGTFNKSPGLKSSIAHRSGISDIALAIIGPPSNFQKNSSVTGWSTPVVSSKSLSPSNSIRRSNSILSRFGSSKKSISAPRALSNYGSSPNAKYSGEETIQVGNAQFEMIKPVVKTPLAQAFVIQERKSSRPNGYYTTESPERRSTTTVVEQGSPTLLRRSRSLTRYNTIEETSIENYRNRESKWIQIIGSRNSLASIKKSKRVNNLVQQGIPSSVRARVYSFLSGADEIPNEGLYDMLCNITKPRGFERYDFDLNNTFKDHPQLLPNSSGRKDMASVVQAFCTWDTGIGYSPGLSSIVAFFLTLTPPEETFNLLISLTKNGTLSKFFENGKVRMKVECMAFGYLLEGIDPIVSKRLAEFSIDPSLYLPFWISSFFITVLPHSTMLRILDLILLDAAYSFKVAIAILVTSRARILDRNLCFNKSSILHYLNCIPEAALSSSVLLPTTFSLKIDSKIKKAIKKAEGLVPGGTKKQRY